MNEEEKKKATEVPGQAPGSGNATAGEAEGAAEGQSKSKWRERLKARKPDLDTEDDDQMDEYLGSQFDSVDRAEEDKKRMNELIAGDERNAQLLSGIFSGKDDDGNDFSLVKYLIQNYWDDLKEYGDSDEALEALDEKLKKQEEEAKRLNDTREEIKSNFANMQKAANDAMQNTGVDEKTMQDVIDWLYGSEADGIEGLFERIAKRSVNEEDFERMVHAFTRDASLEKAREEGRREGRHQRPGAAHRSGVGTPTMMGGGGTAGNGEAEEPENETASRYGRMKPRF